MHALIWYNRAGVIINLLKRRVDICSVKTFLGTSSSPSVEASEEAELSTRSNPHNRVLQVKDNTKKMKKKKKVAKIVRTKTARWLLSKV